MHLHIYRKIRIFTSHHRNTKDDICELVMTRIGETFIHNCLTPRTPQSILIVSTKGGGFLLHVDLRISISVLLRFMLYRFLDPIGVYTTDFYTSLHVDPVLKFCVKIRLHSELQRGSLSAMVHKRRSDMSLL